MLTYYFQTRDLCFSFNIDKLMKIRHTSTVFKLIYFKAHTLFAFIYSLCICKYRRASKESFTSMICRKLTEKGTVAGDCVGTCLTYCM